MTDPPPSSVFDAFEDERSNRRLLRTFAHPLVRYAVYYLREESTASLDRLAEVVLGWSSADATSVTTRADLDETRILLYHAHLPMLESLDLVEFDPDDQTVAMDAISPAVDSFVDLLYELDRAAGDASVR